MLERPRQREPEGRRAAAGSPVGERRLRPHPFRVPLTSLPRVASSQSSDPPLFWMQRVLRLPCLIIQKIPRHGTSEPQLVVNKYILLANVSSAS